MRLGPAPSLCARQDREGPYIEGTGAEGPRERDGPLTWGMMGVSLSMRRLGLGEGTPRCPRARRHSH